MEQRKHPRYLITCPLAFVGEGVVGAGQMVDISLGGCAVDSNVAMTRGLYLQVWILLPDSPLPLSVELAPVRWVAPGQFGMEFIKMRADALDRLARCVTTLASTEEAAPADTDPARTQLSALNVSDKTPVFTTR